MRRFYQQQIFTFGLYAVLQYDVISLILFCVCYFIYKRYQQRFCSNNINNETIATAGTMTEGTLNLFISIDFCRTATVQFLSAVFF